MIDYKKKFMERMADHEDINRLILDMPEESRVGAKNFLKDLVERYGDAICIVQKSMDDPIKRERLMEEIIAKGKVEKSVRKKTEEDK